MHYNPILKKCFCSMGKVHYTMSLRQEAKAGQVTKTSELHKPELCWKQCGRLCPPSQR